jgi:hypothetical protein
VNYEPIYVSLGKKRYVGGTVTEVNAKDISGDTFTIALGLDRTIPPSTGWVAPSVNTVGATNASRILKLLVDNTTPLGTYWVWCTVTDNPEIEPLVLQGPVVVA